MNPHTARHSFRSAARRAFTLLEVMLAGALGLIVIFSVMAFFTTMDRVKRHQAVRMEVNAEMATAHHVIQQALRSLVMSDAGDTKDDEQKDRIEKDIRDAQGPGAEIRDDDVTTMRFALQPDSTMRGPAHAMQTLELVLTTAPIHAMTMSDDTRKQEDLALRQLARMRERKLNLFEDKHSSSASSSGSSSSSSFGSSGLGAKGGSSSGSPESGSNDSSFSSRTSSSNSTSDAKSASSGKTDQPANRDTPDMEAPRAPGVRGVFELRPENDATVLARASDDPGGSAWSLWWRQIPPDDDLVPETGQNAGVRDKQLLALARASRSDGPEVKLLAGLRDAAWQVYRRRNFVPKMAAMNARELPAYVEFKFETIDGRREDWLFEVAWSYGAEPGTVVAANDPLANPAGGAALDPQLALLSQLGLLGPDGKPINPANNPNNPNNPVAINNGGGSKGNPSTGGSNGSTGGNTGGGFGNGGGNGGGSITSNGSTITITLPNGQSITIPNPRR